MTGVLVAEYFFKLCDGASEAFVEKDGILKPVLYSAVAARGEFPFKFKFEVCVFAEGEQVFVDPGLFIGLQRAIFDGEGIAGNFQFAQVTPALEGFTIENTFSRSLGEGADAEQRCNADKSFHRRLSYIKKKMKQRELLTSCTGKKPVTLTLRSGATFRGMPVAVEEEQVALELSDDDCVWILWSEIAAVTLHEKRPVAQNAPQTESEFRQKAMALYARVPLEFSWNVEPPRASEVQTAWEMFVSITESLRALSVDAYMRQEIEGQIQLIRLVSSEAGRFRIADGVLEAGFIENEAVLPTRELQSLLAAIL